MARIDIFLATGRYIAAPSPHEIEDWEEWVASRRQAMLEDYLTAFEKHMRVSVQTLTGVCVRWPLRSHVSKLRMLVCAAQLLDVERA